MSRSYSSLKIIPVFLILLGLNSVPAARAQNTAADTASYPYWIEMMQDPSVNFFDVQRAFEAYWKDRPVTRGSGWKPFKRWEYMMSKRVSPTGERPDPANDLRAYESYFFSEGTVREQNGNWVEMGPKRIPVNANGLGRLNAIAFHPSDPSILWVGAPAGGLWKTTDGGQQWTSNTDGLPTLGVSSIVVDHTNPDILYIGTGDRDAGDSPGIGVMKSTDGGQSWQLTNTGMGYVTVGKMLIHPLNPLLIYAATSTGIYRTWDGAQSWTLISPGGNWKDLVFKPGDPNTIYAATGGSFYHSEDGGNTWALTSNGIPSGARACIGVSPANPEIVYVLMGNSESFKAMYLSQDAGLSFTKQSDSPNILSWGCNGGSGGQAWYDLCVAVDPENADIVFAGGVNIFRSSDKGLSWEIVAHWWGDCDVPNVHADQHVFEWNPLDGKLYVGNDGGCYRTGDNGDTWEMISQGLAISQVYKIGQSATHPGYVINGYQDNGTVLMADTLWRRVHGGDGMECAIDPTNYLYRYATLYYGTINRILGSNNQGSIAGNGVNGITEEGDWVTPFALDVVDPNTMYIGYKNVWKSSNIKSIGINAVSWTKISTTLSSGNCLDLAQSRANPDIIYVVKDNHKFYRTDNASAANPTWVNLNNYLPNASTPTDAEAHPTDPDIVYLASNKKIYKSLDRGVSWTNISGSLPNVNINTIVYYRGSQEGLYIGTDIGVFFKDASMTDWIPFSNGLPANGRVTELEIYYNDTLPGNNLIHACTYGRGLWESPLYSAPPLADFVSNYTQVPLGCAVTFQDLSVGFPTSWAWSFPGGTPSASTAKNPPPVTYSNPGTFDVSLIVSNDEGTDTLLMPGYITSSNTLLPLPRFTASDTIFCSGTNQVTFTDSSFYCPTAWEWSFSPGNVTYVNGTSSSSQHPVVEFTTSGTYTVSLTVSNVNGSSTLTKAAYIRVGGLAAPFFEDFESGNLKTRAWSIENPDNDHTWTVAVTGGNPPGIRSGRMYIYGTNTVGHRDRLITPPLDLSDLETAILSFKHAYAQYQTDYTDSLIVYASDNCGLSWTCIFCAGDDGNGSFATRPPLPAPFTPQSTDDWCASSYGPSCQILNVDNYAGKKNVKFAFETFSMMSNNIYIDDINIASTIGMEEPPREEGLFVFPNPSSGIFNLVADEFTRPEWMKIFSPQGQLIMEMDLSNIIPNIPFQFSLLAWPRGMYYLEVRMEQGKMLRKLLVQ